MMLAGIGVAILALFGEWLFYRRKASMLPGSSLPETNAGADRLHNHIWRAGQMASSVAHKPVHIAGMPGTRRESIGWAETVADGNADGGQDVAKALADIVKCRQRRRRLSHSVSAEDRDEICCISSFEV